MAAREMHTTADRDPKDVRRSVWAMGDYHRVSREVISGLGVALVEAAGVYRGQRVLDVAAGSGNASIPAAQTGASVVASDLTPELLERGRADGAARGAQLEWVEADAEDLPFDDGEFDVVLSCVGAMFAPDHQRAADELLRVCRPGGTIAVLSWTPDGSVGKFFATLAPFGPPPPPGALAPALWGDEDHVRELFGDRVAELDMRRDTLAWDFDDPADLVGYYKAHFGPVIATYEHISGDPDRVAETRSRVPRLRAPLKPRRVRRSREVRAGVPTRGLPASLTDRRPSCPWGGDRDLLDYAHRANRGGGGGGTAKFELECLLMASRPADCWPHRKLCTAQ